MDGSEEASLRRRFEEIEHGRVLSLGKPYHANHQGYDPGWCDRGWQEDRKALVHRLQVEATHLYSLFSEIITLCGVNRAVSCNIIASGGVSNLKDIVDLNALGVYGAIAGKSIYTKALDLTAAITASQRLSGKSFKCSEEVEDHLERYFKKSELIPCIVQEASTNEVLMLAYMNRESMAKTLETGYTWFYSRSRQTLWNKGATSGHTQKIISMYADCDDDTLLVKVVQTGAACHTGSHSCFYKEIARN